MPSALIETDTATPPRNWAAHDLYRTAGHERMAKVCRRGLERAQTVLAAAGLTENSPF
jgi:hypothetical protein